MLESIKLGSSGESVEAWQYFLLGLNVFQGAVDGNFGPITVTATKAFQRKAAVLPVDGWVGTATYAAAFKLGFDPLEYGVVTEGDIRNPAWPERPEGVAPLGINDKHRLFGRIQYKAGAAGSVVITNGWETHIQKVSIPTLAGVKGTAGATSFPFHRRGVRQLAGLFSAWDLHGFTPLILSYAGSWAPRFIRGSTTYLSSHAWGTAFDINAAWNGMGSRPALAGDKGSVRELVELAVDHGFYWGGWFKRKDGMHFELFEAQD